MQQCEEWRRRGSLNPFTGRNILRNGRTFKTINRFCGALEEEKKGYENEIFREVIGSGDFEEVEELCNVSIFEKPCNEEIDSLIEILYDEPRENLLKLLQRRLSDYLLQALAIALIVKIQEEGLQMYLDAARFVHEDNMPIYKEIILRAIEEKPKLLDEVDWHEFFEELIQE